MEDYGSETVAARYSTCTARRRLSGPEMMASIRRDKMQKLLAIVVLVLQIVQSVPSVSPLGLDDSGQSWGGVTPTGQQTHEAAQTEHDAAFKGFELPLMQFHHEQSPYATPHLSLEDRVLIAVKSSRERAEYFHYQISSKGSRASTKVVASSPTYSTQGSYVMQLKIGSPVKTFVAIADTGSDLSWVQCTPCTSCFSQPDPYFNPGQSSSYAASSCTDGLCTALPSYSCGTGNTCDYRYGYGDQSTTAGVLSTETITLTSTSGGTESFPNFAFGCGTNNQGLFADTDGLVGLAQGPVSLVRQLGNQFGNVFSYCLVSFYSSPSKTSPLLLGSTGGSVAYTPLVPNSVNSLFYYVNVIGILVNGNPIDIPPGTFAIDGNGDGGFILDSGTTVTQLQQAAYVPLVNTLASLMDYPRVDGSSIGFDLCYDLSGASNPSVPIVTFRFQNVDVELPGNNIFLQVDDIGDFCFAMQGSPFGFGIYGNVQQQNFNVAYDRANQRVGFARKTC